MAIVFRFNALVSKWQDFCCGVGGARFTVALVSITGLDTRLTWMGSVQPAINFRISFSWSLVRFAVE